MAARSKPSGGIKAIRSTPNISEQSEQAKATRKAAMKRSYSMLDMDDSLKEIIRHVPFLALPGLGQRLRSVSSMANLARMPGEDSALIPKYMAEPQYTWSLMFAVFAAVLGAFQFGYNSGVLNVPEATIREALNIDEFAWALAVSIFCVGGLFGSWIGGRAADYFGRKNFLIANNVLLIMGSLLQGLAYDSSMLCVGRFFVGLGCGGVTVVVPLYLGEISPAALRGSLGTLNQFSTVIGILVANLLGKPFADPLAWRFLVSLTVIPALFQIMMSPLMLESPRWLMSCGQPEPAMQVLSQLRGSDEVDFDMECLELDNEEEAQGQKVGVWALFRTPAFRLPLIVGLCLQLAQQFSGINAVFYYSSSFFSKANLSDPWVSSVMCSAVNVLATAVAIPLMDRVSRRALLLWSALGMLGACISLTVALNWAATAPPSLAAVLDSSGVPSAVAGADSSTLGYASVGSVLLFVVFFEFGLGPIPWLIVAELFPSRVRATAMSAASGLNWMSNFIVGLSFPIVNSYLAQWTFVPFAFILAAVAVFTWVFVPETQGKSLDEIEAGLQGIDEEESSPVLSPSLLINGVKSPVGAGVSNSPGATAPLAAASSPVEFPPTVSSMNPRSHHHVTPGEQSHTHVSPPPPNTQHKGLAPPITHYPHSYSEPVTPLETRHTGPSPSPETPTQFTVPPTTKGKGGILKKTTGNTAR